MQEVRSPMFTGPRILILMILIATTALLRGYAQGDDIIEQHLKLMQSAVATGDLERVQKLLKTPYVSADDSFNGIPFLLLAALRGHDDVVEALLAAGANPTRVTYDGGQTFLMEAVNGGNYSTVVLVLKRLKEYFARARPPLPYDFKSCINQKSFPGGSYLNDVTALWYAVRSGSDSSLQIVELLIENGADPNIRLHGVNNETVLTMTRCSPGYGRCPANGVDPQFAEKVAYLLKHGATY